MEHRINLSTSLLIAVKAKPQEKKEEPPAEDDFADESKPEVRFVWFPNEERYIALYGMEHSEAV